ncbi:hypothetical protein M0813_09240 [Anaeramoeba flamelloides]|uniref:Uncharacterized protein n=1 Tax=Anaeramoeba flamelloides TaxID=1746091 RepID=A0ABQ8X618_9EUKA|nr:hypothetical protein M0813_09240 [Anaeramoeba flamelloides]
MQVKNSNYRKKSKPKHPPSFIKVNTIFMVNELKHSKNYGMFCWCLVNRIKQTNNKSNKNKSKKKQLIKQHKALQMVEFIIHSPEELEKQTTGYVPVLDDKLEDETTNTTLITSVLEGSWRKLK